MFGIIFFLLTWQSYTQFAFDKVIAGEVDKKDLEKKEAKQNKKQRTFMSFCENKTLYCTRIPVRFP